MHVYRGPVPVRVRSQTPAIKYFSDGGLALSLFGKTTEDLAHNRYFFLRSVDQYHPICLDTLSLSLREQRFWIPVLIDEEASEAVPGYTALPKTELREPTLACENLDGKLAAKFSRHRSLYRL